METFMKESGVRVLEVGKEFLRVMERELFIKGSGRMIRRMDLECW